MGMFDSFYDKDGGEWQTKAFERLLTVWRIGDKAPGPLSDYQAETIGGEPPFVWKFATVRGGVLVSAGDERDETLPLVTYSGEGVTGGYFENG